MKRDFAVVILRALVAVTLICAFVALATEKDGTDSATYFVVMAVFLAVMEQSVNRKP